MIWPIFQALTWLVMCIVMAIAWWLDLPFGTGAKLMIAYAMLDVGGRYFVEAFRAIDRYLDRRYRRN
jgi:uncharacterized membrane protein YccC